MLNLDTQEIHEEEKLLKVVFKAFKHMSSMNLRHKI